MPKDDPLGQTGFAPRHLWLDREGMLEARKNYWEAFKASGGTDISEPIGGDERIWRIAWAAYFAAHSFTWEGRTEPR